MRVSTLPLLALPILLVIAACGDDWNTPSVGDGPLVVATSVPPHAWLVEQIAGEHATVLSLVGADDDPHTYLPADAQVSDVMRARIWFRAGVAFEDAAWSGALRSRKTVRIVDLRESLEGGAMAEGPDEDGHTEGEHGSHQEHGHRGEDPHTWLSIANLGRQALTIAAALGEVDPENAGDYTARADALRETLAAADTRIRAQLAGLAGRRMYVFHPAWGYFCDAYGLVQVPIELEGKSPSESELTSLIDMAADDDASVIFVQPQIRGAPAVALAEAVGARIEYLDPLEKDVLANLEHVAEVVAAALR